MPTTPSSAPARARIGRRCGLAVAIACSLATGACLSDDLQRDPVPLTRPRTDRIYLRDGHDRYLSFHGVNVSGSSKVPVFLDAANGLFTYVGKPFPLEAAEAQIQRLADLGFNAFRLLVIWEGVEPEHRGEYDQEYLGYLREVVRIAGEHGIYVLVDMHQDMFSRHLRVKYNEHPAYGEPGSIEASLTSLIPPYTDLVQGDGAPRWVVAACLPDKDMDSPNWGTPRLVSGLGPEGRANLVALAERLSGTTTSSGDGEVPEWVEYISDNAPPEFPVNETTDMMPFTNWGVSSALSTDIERAYGCLFAGDKLFPGLTVGGVGIQEYLQEAYANAWVQVALHVGDLPNVMGYDLMNEPQSNFITLAAVGAAIKAGGLDAARQALIDLLGAETGDLVFLVAKTLRILPPAVDSATLQHWGLDKLDPLAAATINFGFDRNYLRPFYSRVGQAIQSVDPDAVIFIEGSSGIGMVLGSDIAGGMWDMSMTGPEGIEQIVYAPHVYADIYPFIGFNQPPREFSVEEVRYRDYGARIAEVAALAEHSLGNVPVVFGEFGTYFNFNGIEASRAADYEVSAHVLDNYYEAWEERFQSRLLWCYSPENDYRYGDLWNKEDFSIIDPLDQTRAEVAWSRPFARALAGKPVATHFYSPLHYFDPDKGEPNAEREFEVRYRSQESSAPTEIFVPRIQYPDGFYVWVSDGRCYYDHATRILYHYPDRDEPGIEHWLRLRPPLPNAEVEGWRYFFDGPRVVRR
ncbi:MAG: cellulase family glycosylhydrolase [Deltaproteobacteria bacterium]|nr:cellulase family glycosylhydrolase [Deltaproteobacteria bacterium]